MSTTAQITANRENAIKSTGPKTIEGKSESSQNATKHGFYASQDVINRESQADYDMLRDELIEDLKPIGPMQRILAERIVSLTWRLERTMRMHNQTFDALIKNEGWEPDLPLGHIAQRDFANDRTLDKLMMFERRMENSLYKTIKQLKNLQKEKAKNQANSRNTQYDIRNTKIEPDVANFLAKNMPWVYDRLVKMNAIRKEDTKNIQNEPNSNAQMDVTPEITKDYEHAIISEALSLVPSQTPSAIPTEQSEPGDL